MRSGTLSSLKSGAYNIILGEPLARALSVVPGDRIVLVAPQGQVTPAGVIPRLRQFTVAGKAASTDDVRSVLEDAGQANTEVLILGRSGVRVQTEELSRADRDAITSGLADYAGIDASDISVTNVGPSWGERVSRKLSIPGDCHEGSS